MYLLEFFLHRLYLIKICLEMYRPFLVNLVILFISFRVYILFIFLCVYFIFFFMSFIYSMYFIPKLQKVCHGQFFTFYYVFWCIHIHMSNNYPQTSNTFCTCGNTQQVQNKNKNTNTGKKTQKHTKKKRKKKSRKK